MKQKKGEITTQQIVLLIILIASFAVILFFIFRLNLGKTSIKEVCHNSVVSRSSSVLPEESIPLNCKTTYTCITKDGSCEKMSGSPEIKKAKTKNDVYDILANEMADCWWMFGEGKLNYVGKDLLADNLYCSICSQLAFDNSSNDIFSNGEIDKKDFYDYLSKKNISGKDKSYLDYLVGLKSSEIKSTLQDSNSDFGKINFGKQYYVIMGIVSDVSALKWVGAGIILVGTTAAIVLTAGSVAPILIAIGTAGGAGLGGIGGYFAGTMLMGESGNSYLTPTIIEANSADFDKLNCKEIRTLA